MAIVSFSKLARGSALRLLESQKTYTPGQAEMAMNHPHLVWVTPPNKGLPRGLRMKVWERCEDGRCQYCRTQLCIKTFTVDHVLARANGGGDELENLVVACRYCNSSKRDLFVGQDSLVQT